jgi:hypothetical protein
VKARVNPMISEPAKVEDADERTVKFNERKDYDFLANGKGDSEETGGNKGLGRTHAPY